jgi:2-hydroxycyclohexanecarboxyl-CoA dehydrogenase
VVIVGGAGEIGAATAIRFARNGAAVWVVDQSEDRGKTLAQELSGEGHTAAFLSADATDLDSMSDCIGRIARLSHGIDIAVNAVGWTFATPFLESDPIQWKRMVDLNLMSAINLTYAVLPGMIKRRYGRIVLISSLAGREARPGQALYCAGKAGVIGFTRAIALEFARAGITVNTIAPGSTDTKLLRDQGEEFYQYTVSRIPRGKPASVDDQANAIAFLSGQDAAHITGQTLAIDGGQTMI